MRRVLAWLAAAVMLAATVALAGCGGDTASSGFSPFNSATAKGTTPAKSANGAYSWTNAPWGGGGYVSGMLYHPRVKDLLYARTDVGGVYRWDPVNWSWIALNDDLGRDDSQLTGIVSMAVDANDLNKLYLAAGQYTPSWGRTAAILRSNDQGRTWARTELPIRLGGNWDGRGMGERLQVDPNKGSILLLGTNQDGLWKSTDSGVTWAKVTGFSPSAVNFVVFDPRSGSAGTATQVLYAGLASNTTTSLMKSTDGGATWAAVPGQPVALMPHQAALDANGSLYITFSNALGPNNISDGAVYKLNTATGVWTNITPQTPGGFGYSGVSVAASTPGMVVVSTIDLWWPGDTIYRSMDGGATWTSLKDHSLMDLQGFDWVKPYWGGDINNRLGHWITDVDIDPFNSNNAIYNTGFGLWMSNSLTSSTVTWGFHDRGLEETVVLDVDSPRSGDIHLFTAQGDVGGARYSDFSPREVGNYNGAPTGTDLSIAAAGLNPSIVVRSSWQNDRGFISRDSGDTWTKFKTNPLTSSSVDPGHILISAQGTSLLWVPRGQAPIRSENNGDTWTAVTGWPTVPSDQYFLPVADASFDGYYYVYDYPNARLYESSDGGKTFAITVTGLPQWQGSDLVSVPGDKRRDLWIATEAGLYHIDGPTASPVKVAGIDKAYRVTYGAPAPGQTYWAIFVWGKVGSVTGLFRSDDAGANWVRINDDAHQYGWYNDIAGDPRVYGRIYLATGGRGVIIGNR